VTTEKAHALEQHETESIARAASGDAGAFAQLVAQCEVPVTRLVHRLLGWRGDVDDVVQEVFVAVFTHLRQFRGECRVSTWVYGIAVNECRRARRFRFRRWRLWTARPSTPAAADTADRMDADERNAHVRTAMERLPRRDHEVLVLRYLESLEISEISAILGLARNVVEVRLTRARARLRALLADWHEQDERDRSAH
jgi:RNA polymerase sigma-70 factor, ECF subfamily